MTGSRPKIRPLELHLERNDCLRIAWSDGRIDRIPLVALRRACPCATCKAQREAAQNPLHVLSPSSTRVEGLSASGIALVGAYGVKICWSDGHETGIFNYALLRELGAGPKSA